MSSTSTMSPDSTRIEKDSMGEMHVPADVLYGASTQRAVLNFDIDREVACNPAAITQPSENLIAGFDDRIGLRFRQLAERLICAGGRGLQPSERENDFARDGTPCRYLPDRLGNFYKYEYK